MLLAVSSRFQCFMCRFEGKTFGPGVSLHLLQSVLYARIQRVVLRRQAFGLGASLRLIAKPFLCADPRRFASGSACFLPVRRFCCGFAAQRFVRLPTPSCLASSSNKAQPERRRPLLRKKQQAAKPGPYGYLPAQPYGNNGPETARIGGQACLGPLPGPAATSCDEAAERRRTAGRPRLAP
jgi:hypothetical protein